MIGVVIALRVIGLVIVVIAAWQAVPACRRWWQWRAIARVLRRQRMELRQSRRNGHNRSGRVTRE